MFPRKIKEVLLFYFISPIIIYGSYIHSQLDLIPMALLVLSIYLLVKNKIILSSIVLGFALSTKLHVIAALPLIVVYLFRNHKKTDILYFLLFPAAIYILFSVPYIFSKGYVWMVLRNPKQMTIFDTIYQIGDLKIYVPIFVIVVVYARFLAYRKINKDLLYTFLGMLFSVFILFIFPAPGWYIWIVPFLSLFFIGYYNKYENILPLYLALNVVYLTYFLFFFISDYHDLIFLNIPLNIKIHSEKLRNIVYTVLQVTLCATLYSLYKFGVKSNSVYKKNYNLIIGIGGDSAAGKNTLLSDIKLLLGERLLELEGDADHKWGRGDENWQQFTHLNPKANYLHKQANDLLALKYGKSILRGDYDHVTGGFKEQKVINPKEFIILCGLHPFYLPIARKAIGLKIYLDTEKKLRHQWKILRDMQERGYSKETVLEQINKRTGDAKKHIYPQKEFADLIISYSAEGDLEAGEYILNLKVIMDSSIHLENLIGKLKEEGVDIYWDYADDLKRQYLILNRAPDKETIMSIAREIIPNIDEIVAGEVDWMNGLRGFVQLIILLMISEKMKEEVGYNE